MIILLCAQQRSYSRGSKSFHNSLILRYPYFAVKASVCTLQGYMVGHLWRNVNWWRHISSSSGVPGARCGVSVLKLGKLNFFSKRWLSAAETLINLNVVYRVKLLKSVLCINGTTDLKTVKLPEDKNSSMSAITKMFAQS
jgi:hypothetical protein